MSFEKNQIYTVTIEDIGTDGEGIGKVDGFPLFVKDALPGDVAKVKIVKAKKNYAFARLEEIISPSADRVEPPCPYHRQCGGCQIQALSYEKQLEFKQQKVKNNLMRLGGFSEEFLEQIMEPIIGMDNPWRYRNKAQYPFGYSKEKEIITGFYAGRTHSIIANTDCLLGVEENKEVLEVLLSYMKKQGVTAYEETSGKGLIRHVLVRKGFASGQLMVCIIINGKYKGDHTLPAQDKLCEALAQIPNMTSISVNINRENTNVIMGDETHVIWGEDRIEDSLRLLKVERPEGAEVAWKSAQAFMEGQGDLEKESDCKWGFSATSEIVNYRISARSFYQVNPIQTEKLYSVALDYAGLSGKETVWDLYCGIGTISLFLASHAKKVYGVEIIEQAILDARENAKANHIENAEFFVGKAEEVLPDFYEGKIGDGEASNQMRHPDVIVVDPPRKGCDEMCLFTILKMQPEKVVYVSCDSATLARDLKILCDGGYELKRVRACDQFCHSTHVESVVLITRKEK